MPNPLGRALRNRRAGHHTLVWALPELAAPENFTLTSPAFEHGMPIPERHRGHLRRADISPALAWSPAPADAAELVLVVQDPDVPGRRASVHLLAAGIQPRLLAIGEDGLAKSSALPGLVQGRGALGHRGWAGPAPIPSHGAHSYVFQLFAVDVPLGLPAGFRLEDAVASMAGHLVGRARLDGTYEVA